MADRSPLTDNAPPSMTNGLTNTSSMASPPLDSSKHEDSMSRFASVDADTPVPDDTDSTSTAGRKRKLSGLSARGVANLTPEQLAKKRANDRQAQRAIRERTKAHIDALEQQVRELSSQKPIYDLQAALRQNEAIQAENRELKDALKRVMDVVQPMVGKGAYATPASDAHFNSVPPAPSPLPDSHRFTPSGHRPSLGEQSYTESGSSVGTPSSIHSTPAFGYRRDSASSTPSSASFRIAFDYQRHNLAHGLDLGSEERLGFNFLLNGPPEFPKVDTIRRSSEYSRTPNPVPPTPISPLSGQQPSAFSAPIRNVGPTCTLDAILLDFLHHRQREAAQGVPKQRLVGPPYPSVSSLLNPQKSAYTHPVSKVFTDILRTFPDISSLPEQVAVLYIMFILMRWQIYPTQENYDRLPEWMTPRPSQLMHPHPAWMDYLPWPRMRDRVVMNYQDYPFENWFIPFTRTLSVNWPYEHTDCLLSMGDADDLIINPVFERHFRNLNNWSLGPAFADAYPGLVDTTRIKTN